jgi:N-acetylneuraminate synthase
MKKNLIVEKNYNNCTKIICELGINHNGSIKDCKKLIKQAFDSGSWGVKFQYRNLNNYFSNYKKNTELGKEIIDKEIVRNYLSPRKIKSLSKYAKKLGINVGISFFSSKDILDFSKFNFDFYKIPSSSCDNFDLLKKILSLKKLTLISFGGKTLILIKKILKNVPENLRNKVAILHCVSNYPLNIINSNLGFIDILKKKFKNYLIGYSSHEKAVYNCIYALSKKINFIERHITLNKNAEGLDHASSSEFHDFETLNFYCKNLAIIDNQNYYKRPNQGEIINIQNLGCSYVFKKNLKSGTVLKKNFLQLSQPKIGIDDLEIDKYLGLRVNKNVKKNTPLISSLFKENKLLNKHSLFIKKKKISIPIRPHDYKQLQKEINTNFYEFHLSYKDVNNFNKNNFSENFIKNNFFSIHAPDYIDQNNILDLFSANKKIRQKSLRILEKCIMICKFIKSVNNSDTKLIISISKYDKQISKVDFYLQLLNFLKKIKKKENVEVLPQWLPVYAWYFGGSNRVDIFSNPLDLKILNKINLKICLDTSHFLLSCNYYNILPDKIFFENLRIYNHFHLSDAKGIDGEGVKLGKGELFKTKLFRYILKQSKSIVVLETWQGHLNSGIGFKKDIKALYLKDKYGS